MGADDGAAIEYAFEYAFIERDYAAGNITKEACDALLVKLQLTGVPLIPQPGFGLSHEPRPDNEYDRMVTLAKSQEWLRMEREVGRPVQDADLHWLRETDPDEGDAEARVERFTYRELLSP